MRTLLAALFTLLYVQAYAQPMLSPKLSQFLTNHPGASTTLSNALWEARLTRPVHIYYFYAGEEFDPPTMHRYLDGGTVLGIFVRENQSACDECIDILFEAVNSKGAKRFEELWDKVKAGTITKSDFVRQMRRQEFEAVLSTKALLSKFKLSGKEAADSVNYKPFADTPSDFDKFLTDTDERSKGAHRKYYEEEYDGIRKEPKRN